MKSIQARFNKIQEENPNLSSYICFVRTVEGKNYSDERIRFWFNKLVEKQDHLGVPKNDLFLHLRSF